MNSRSDMKYQPFSGTYPIVVVQQDLVTGKVWILLETTTLQSPQGHIFVYDGMIYYARIITKLEIDENDPISALMPGIYTQHLAVPHTPNSCAAVKEEAIFLRPILGIKTS